ncbi:hypothetical protein MARCHEWKA_01930 [Brevundimonas phage vB_BpoS-Marchewka]|uniref:Uncharacterized protein n=1 Tax=Brevundimonas phage vB_BpoS-Marchewka TaxID=2948604 RepID=A0A9E7N2J6_9CAUD|nr:hypothetical protein MARCHEWKA_01930 [Brevundimonas phage vB_BpoS-Marchewka]UTC29152.1 hypothetical protein BAMBUS_00690 [Brevundimonas phage vB_BpoS-Bambus]
MIGTRRHQEHHFVKRLEPLSEAFDMDSARARAVRILNNQPFICQVDIVWRSRNRAGRLEETLLETCRRTGREVVAVVPGLNGDDVEPGLNGKGDPVEAVE